MTIADFWSGVGDRLVESLTVGISISFGIGFIRSWIMRVASAREIDKR